MKRAISISIISVLVLTGFLTVAQTSISPSRAKQSENKQDTIPEKREGKIKDLDAAMEELERTMQQLDIELKKPIPPLPPLEVKKMQAELDQALKEVDPEKIKIEIDLAMKQIDAEKIKTEVQASLAKVDMENVHKEIERIKEIELPKLNAEIQKLGPQIEKSMQEAKGSIEKVKIEMQEYKEFEYRLEKDGLINKNNYTIDHHNGIFTIDGKQQTEAVYNKYRSFLEKHTDLTLKKNQEGLEIKKEKD